MFGRLNADALPFYSPVALGGAAMTVGAGVTIVILITVMKKWRYLYENWFTTLDHKKIGVMYALLALVMLVRGFVDAFMMRTQQALALNNSSFLGPEHFDQVFSAHGTIMIFFMAMPFLVGLANFVVPLQIGARDVSFPFLNAVSFWLTAAAAGLVLISLVIGKFSTAGWTAYPPYSGAEFNPGVGVDYWIWAVLISGVGSTLTAVNFIATILQQRTKGMTLMRMPLFTWTIFFTALLMLFSFPAITVSTAMLAADRYLDMHFFTNDGGGNAMNYVNLFWIWGHPEVYILVLPAFGVYSEVISTFSGKKLFGYTSLVYATGAIALLSYTVWLHHFFTMGAGPSVNAVFGIASMIIGVPTGVKIFNWLFTMYRGRIRFYTPMYYAVGFMVLFVIGGMTGILLAIPPVDFIVHNSTFLVAHFHNVIIPGVLFGFLAGYQYWFPKAFGFRLNELWGRLSFVFWFFGFLFAFMPLYWLGLQGMPRRLEHYSEASWQPWLVLAQFGALLIAAGIACLAIQLIVSIKNRKTLIDQTGDPWNGRTLEWTTSSPPPVYNFATPPEVREIDDLWERKRRGEPYPFVAPPKSIVLPRSTAAPVAIGALAFTGGFALIWYIWWLAALSGALMLAVLIARSFVDNSDQRYPVALEERTV